MNVEIVYRVRVDYDLDDWLSATDRLLTLGKGLDHCEVFEGCPACYPYVIGETTSKTKAEKFAGKVERYILKRKGGRLNP